MNFEELIKELEIAKEGLSEEDLKEVNAIAWVNDNLKE